MTTPVFASGANGRVSLVAEVTAGVTPASPTMIEIPVVKFDLSYDTSINNDQSIYADRMERFVVAGLKKVSGSISVNLSHTNFSPLIQTAMFSTWASNVIKTGTALQTLTLEKWHSDIATGWIYTGCFADKTKIKMSANGFVTADFTIAGISSSKETSALAASPTAPTVETPYVMVSATLLEGGSAIAYLTSLDIDIDNTAQPSDALGSVNPIVYTPGMSKVSGTMSAYIPTGALYAKYDGQTATSIDVVLTDGTNTLEFNIPNVRYTGFKAPLQGQANLPQTLNFVALRDSSSSSNLVVMRS